MNIPLWSGKCAKGKSEKIRAFVLEARNAKIALHDEAATRSQANGAAFEQRNDGSVHFRYEHADWVYTETSFGDIPCAGMVTVTCRGIVRWVATYSGEYKGNSLHKEAVADFLELALAKTDVAMPIRGPKHFTTVDYLDLEGYYYANSWNGKFPNVRGRETVSRYGKRIARINYASTYVNVR